MIISTGKGLIANDVTIVTCLVHSRGRSRITFAQILGAVRREAETLSVTEHISALLVSQATNCVTVRETLALVSRAVRGVGEAAPVTPLIHT